MKKIVISLMVVNALVTFAQVSSDNGSSENSRYRRGLKELSRNRRTLLPILRKLRELKSQAISKVLGFKKQKKGRFLSFKKNPFPQFPFGIPAKPPTGGKPVTVVNLHHHKPHKTKSTAPQTNHYKEHKTQHVKHEPHQNEHNKPSLIVNSYGSPIAPAIPEVDSYGSPLAPVASSYEAPPVDVPNSYFAPAPTYSETPAPSYTPVVTYVKETPASPPAYETEILYGSPLQQPTYTKHVQDVSEEIDPYNTIAVPPPYEAPAHFVDYKQQEIHSPLSLPITTYLDLDPPAADTYGTPVSQPITNYVSDPEPQVSDAYGTPVSQPITTYVYDPEPQVSDAYGTPVSQPITTYVSHHEAPQTDAYGIPVSQPITTYVSDPEPQVSDTYGTSKEPVPIYYAPSLDLPAAAPSYVSHPITDSYGFPLSEPNSYGIPLSDPLTSYEPIIQEDPVPNTVDNTLPSTSNLIPESELVPFAPNSPEDSFSAPVDQIPSTFDGNPRSSNPSVPGDPIIMSTFDQQFEVTPTEDSNDFLPDTQVTSTEDSNDFLPDIQVTSTEGSNDILPDIQVTSTEDSSDLLPDIFITTKAPETTQVPIDANDSDDTENAPVAEPASEHPDAEGPSPPNIADLVNLRVTDKYVFGFTAPQNLSTHDDASSPQGNFPREPETSDISVAAIDTSTETPTSAQTTPGTSQPSNTEQTLNSSDKKEPEPDQEDNAGISDTNEAPTVLPSEETISENDGASSTVESEPLETTFSTNTQTMESSTKPTADTDTDTEIPFTIRPKNTNRISFVFKDADKPFNTQQNNTNKIASITKDDIVRVNKKNNEKDDLPEFAVPGSASMPDEKQAENDLLPDVRLPDSASTQIEKPTERFPNKSEKRKVVRKKLKGSNNKNTVSTNPERPRTNNKGNENSLEDVDILNEEVEKTSATTEKLILPRPQQIPPFNTLSALFPYYNIDPASIQNEDLMPILIEDIFLSEDYDGEGDYDLLPFYDLDNYDIEFEDNFLVYDATLGGSTEQTVPSFYL